jgi:hypothetical protein
VLRYNYTACCLSCYICLLTQHFSSQYIIVVSSYFALQVGLYKKNTAKRDLGVKRNVSSLELRYWGHTRTVKNTGVKLPLLNGNSSNRTRKVIKWWSMQCSWIRIVFCLFRVYCILSDNWTGSVYPGNRVKCAWFQASAANELRTALFWVIRQRVVVISYRCWASSGNFLTTLGE